MNVINELVSRSIMPLCEGNPGCASVLSMVSEILKEEIFPFLNILRDMDIKGYKVWVVYKDLCDQDIKKFIKCIQDKDKEVLNAINENQRG